MLIFFLFRSKHYKLLKLDDAGAELRSVEEENRELREGLARLVDQFPQAAHTLRRISNGLVKIAF